MKEGFLDITDPRGVRGGVVWDDISQAVAASRLDVSSGRLDYDYFNGAIKFQSNARYPEEPVVIPIQAKHSMLIGEEAVARVHFHWLQEQAAIPNMLLAYKKTNYGSTTIKETNFNNYTLLPWISNAYTYTSGVLAQITKFAEIDISDLTISGTLDLVLFRDSANTSTLFAGVDPVAADVLIKFVDAHVKFDAMGSLAEFAKNG